MNSLETIHGSLGDLRRLIAAYADLLHGDPAYVEACYLIGILCESLGHYPEARMAYRAVLRMEPDYIDTQSRLIGLDAPAA